MPLPLRGIHRASATLCGMPPPFRSGHLLLVFPLLILQTQAVRSLGVAQMLLRAGSMVRGRRYNCDVVLCEAALFDGRNDWVSRLNISDGPPWVVIGDLPHSLHGVSNVFAVNTSMMQRRLRERLEMVFNPNSTPSRAPPDMADREHPNPTTAQPCNATPNNATPSMGMSVLSVDDVSMNQLIMGSFLKRLGAQVHLAENGRQACYLNPAPASYTPLLWSWREHPPPPLQKTQQSPDAETGTATQICGNVFVVIFWPRISGEHHRVLPKCASQFKARMEPIAAPMLLIVTGLHKHIDATAQQPSQTYWAQGSTVPIS